MRIVIIDDSLTNTAVMAALARSLAAEVTTYRCPLAALDRIAGDEAEVIIVDFSMPGMDGVMLTERLRQHDLYPDTPILMVTHEGSTGVRLRAREAGVTGFLRKPFDAIEFKATLRRLSDGKPRRFSEADADLLPQRA
jgi:CheY-like chemotaxis protein